MPNRHDDVVRRLAEACRLADVDALRAVLDPDAVVVCDGGGSVPGGKDVVVHGAAEVSRLVAGLLCGHRDGQPTIEAVNGRTGLALRRAGRVVAVIAVEELEDRAAVLWIVLNPVKLRSWNRG